MNLQQVKYTSHMDSLGILYFTTKKIPWKTHHYPVGREVFKGELHKVSR